MRAHEQWSEHTKRLQPLVVSDKVRIQNQFANILQNGTKLEWL